MEPNSFLRFEGAVTLLIALLAYFSLDGPLWMLLVLALAPDLSMLGYLVSNRFGQSAYNVIHTHTVPMSLGTTAWLIDSRLVLLVSFVWIGHIGADRMVGYGLKYATGFKDTHLSLQPVKIADGSEGESAP